MEVIDVSVTLDELRALVDEVASEEEVVFGSYGHGVAHEDCGVDYQGSSHFTGDARLIYLVSHLFGSIQVGVRCCGGGGGSLRGWKGPRG